MSDRTSSAPYDDSTASARLATVPAAVQTGEAAPVTFLPADLDWTVSPSEKKVAGFDLSYPVNDFGTFGTDSQSANPSDRVGGVAPSHIRW